MQRAELLVFCEVKTTRAGSVFGVQQRLGAAQQRRLRKAAAAWLGQNPALRALQVRFDAAFVTLDSTASDEPQIAYYEGAF